MEIIRYTSQRKIEKLIEHELTITEFILYSYSEEDYKGKCDEYSMALSKNTLMEHNIPIKIIIPNE